MTRLAACGAALSASTAGSTVNAGQPRLYTQETSLFLSNFYTRHFHRHLPPVKFHLWSLMVHDSETIRGCATIFRPSARALDDGHTVEVTRCSTDGCPNACSALYGAAARTAKQRGYKRIITYTHGTEPGTSLRASGWTPTTLRKNGGGIRRYGCSTAPRRATTRWEKDL